MVYLSYICFILYIHHSCDSYVLLTANVDDVHAIADQVAKSPVLEQIKNIWQEASKTFYHHYDQRDPKRSKTALGNREIANKFHFVESHPPPDVRFPQGFANAPVLRSSQPLVSPKESRRRNGRPSSQLTSSSKEARDQRRQAANALMDLGRNASVYLRSLQTVLENL